jgi:hypothetical protein
MLQRLSVDDMTISMNASCPVDAKPVTDDQLYPVAVSQGDRIVVAWEDRRPGHTIIMAAQSDSHEPCKFTSPQRISEALPGHSATYGKGHGVARVALAGYGHNKVMAAWADKRDFREGYDIYAAVYQVGNSDRLFGDNTRVQDSFGGIAQQWHPTVTGDSNGRLVVAWDDKRDGDANIMLSWLEDTDWSDDLAVPGASGQGVQNHPSICLDGQGNLHLVWVERNSVGGPTRLRYTYGKISQ